MERRNLLIDVDDTINALQKELLAYVNRHSVTRYNYWQLTAAQRDSEDPLLDQLAQEFLQQPDLVLKSLPYPHALTGVQLLHQANFRLHVASARKEDLHTATKRWLAQHGFMPFIEEIHHRPSEIRSFNFKVYVANLINAQAAFDDTVSIAEALADNGTMVYLIRRPWNREITGNHVIRPYRSFYQAAVAFLNHNNGTH